MSILDQLLGSNDNTSVDSSSDSSSFELGAAPGLNLGLSDVLGSSSTDEDGSESSDFSGIGEVGLGLSAPVMIGTSSSSESASASDVDGNDGGLLGGLL